MKVVIADDHQLAREGLKIFLRSLDENVDVLEAANLFDALSIADKTSQADPIDLVMLDLLMPGMDGLSGLDQAVRKFKDVPVVVVSAVEDPKRVDAVLNHGARGYILKGMPVARVVAALVDVLNGETYRPPVGEDAARYDRVLEQQSSAWDMDLTPREREVLRHLVEGLSNKEIARRMELREVTIKAHLGGVFRKLEVSNRTQAVKAAIRGGWANQ